ncbi:MAG: NUDIX domain-containing protein [Microgenomates group bacterium]
MKYQYKYCSNCGELFDKKSETLYLCPKCDFRIFVSPKPSVGIFLFNQNGELLLIKRSIDPGKGLWGIPGGFINPNETLIEAAKRESLEEIGYSPDSFSYFNSYYGDYDYKGVVYKTISTIFVAKIDDDNRIKISDDESSEFKFFRINDISSEMIGTEDVKKAVTELIQSKLH